MNKRRCLTLLLAAVLIIIAAGCGPDDSSGHTPEPTLTVAEGEDTLKVLFLDVGKGDSALIGIPGGYWVMIDTGPKEGFPEIGRQLVLNSIDKLSAVFLTHGHSDHIGGLDNVLSMTGFETLYTNADALSEKKVQKASAETQIKQLKKGDTVSLGEASFTVLGPIGNYADENDNSLVIMLEYKEVKLLFTADQLLGAEHDLMQEGTGLDADVLKVAHHGKDDTSSLEFIKAVSPVYAVITTDLDNPPSQQVINSITIAGGQSYVLGETGTMLLESDGKDSKISPLPAPDIGLPDVRIEALDFSFEYVTIANHSGETVDLTGWCVCSEKGGETYFFPEGISFAPGEKISVYSGDASLQAEGLFWTTEKVWSKKDTCVIYDSFGRQAARS